MSIVINWALVVLAAAIFTPVGFYAARAQVQLRKTQAAIRATLPTVKVVGGVLVFVVLAGLMLLTANGAL